MKTKAHTIYQLKDGTKIPGVTTIINILDKPALIPWAWKLGIQGIDYRKYKDDKAMIGSLVHEMILAYLKNEKPDTSDYSKNQIDQAENCLLSFFEWEKDKKLEPILIEKPLVSEKYRFGGTSDFYGEVNGKLTVMDFKSGSGIYDEMIIQINAYEKLLIENNHPVETQRILRIPRKEDETFEDRIIGNNNIGWQIFLNCLNIYHLKKQLKEF